MSRPTVPLLFARIQLVLILVGPILSADTLAQSGSEPGPQIRLEQLPPHGQAGWLRGRVVGAAPASHAVAPILHVEGLGWYSKPTDVQPTIPIASDGRFELFVAANGLDHYAVHYFVALIPAGVSPPVVLGCSTLPTSPHFLATDLELRYGRTIDFAGFTWGVKEAALPVGPGGNRFSAAPDMVFVDGAGRLHLRVENIGGVWYSSEVVLLSGEGQGRYWFTTASDVDAQDARVTAGMFSWDPYGGGGTQNPNCEIDFEDSRWGDPHDPTNSQFVVQPAGDGQLFRYTMPPMPAGGRVTRELIWTPERLRFVTLHGVHPLGRAARADLIASWTFPHDPDQGRAVPDSGRAQWRFNLWLNDPAGTASGQGEELVIEDFDARWFE